jgi:zinc protease
MQDLEAASVEDVRDFWRTYYVPSNATLTLVGDFDSDQALQIVQRYFGRVPKPAKPVPRDIPVEPPQTKEKRVMLDEPWPLPAVVVAYHITYDGNPDSYPLHMASKILSDGNSSRIYRKLVYETELALTAFGGGNIIEHPNLFFAVGIVQPGHTPADVERALIGELDRMRTEPVSEHELQRAKNQFARDYIVARETVQEKAAQLAHAVVIHNDIKTADGEFDIFQGITAADIHHFADAAEVVRRELPYFFRVSLRTSLVRSLEPQMVCRFLADHLPAIASAMACPGFLCHRPRHGLHGGAVCRHLAFDAWCLSLCAALG